MSCQITIQTVGSEMVVDMKIHDSTRSKHTAWRSESVTTLDDVLQMLPEMARKLEAGEIGS